MIRKLLMLTLLFNSCNEENTHNNKVSETNINSDYFNDVNLFALEGIGKIGKTYLYPFIEIQNVSDTERNIIYHSSKENSKIREYKRHREYWLCTYPEVGDTSVEKVYEYVLPNKIICLNYFEGDSINRDFVLKSVSVLQDWKETYYLLESNDTSNRLTPSIAVSKIIADNAVGSYTKEISVKNGVLSFQEKDVDRNGHVVYVNKVCYEIGNHSYFRWRYLDNSSKQIDCN